MRSVGSHSRSGGRRKERRKGRVAEDVYIFIIGSLGNSIYHITEAQSEIVCTPKGTKQLENEVN